LLDEGDATQPLRRHHGQGIAACSNRLTAIRPAITGGAPETVFTHHHWRMGLRID